MKPFAFILALVMMLTVSAGCESRPAPVLPPAQDAGQMVIADDPPPDIFTTAPERPKITDSDPFAKPNPEPEPASPTNVPASSTPPPVSSAPPPVSSAPPSISSTPPPVSSAAPSVSSTPPLVSSAPPSVSSAAPVSASPVAGEVRAVWVSYLELTAWLSARSQSQFTARVREAFDNCLNFGINTVIVQVRPFADALYESQYFPWSRFASGTEGVHPGFDPLEIMVREARTRGLRIEAWVNPYRVSHNVSANPLSQNNMARVWLNGGGNHAAQSANGWVVFNPASEQARNLIINGIREIIRNYGVDGIHIDDYFYPITGTDFDSSFDLPSYQAYRGGGGNLSHADWRRQNVDTLLRAMYAAVKQENPNALFGISPESSLDTNFNRAYFDVEKALSTPGYCDYIAPQIYFGFQNEVQPFRATLDRWNALIKVSGVKLYVGLAVYKSGYPDSWARSGSAEWQNNTNLLARMVQYSRDASNYAGFILYRYDSLFNPEPAVRSHVQREAANLLDILN